MTSELPVLGTSPPRSPPQENADARRTSTTPNTELRDERETSIAALYRTSGASRSVRERRRKAADLHGPEQGVADWVPARPWTNERGRGGHDPPIGRTVTRGEARWASRRRTRAGAPGDRCGRGARTTTARSVPRCRDRR